MNEILKRSWNAIAALAVLLAAASLLTGQILTKVGPQQGSDGTTPAARSTRLGNLVIQQGSGKYSEAIFRGNCYCVSNGVAGQAVGATVSTTASIITLWNPQGSGKTIKVYRASFGYISGTFGAGSIAYVINNTNTATSPSGGTALTPSNALVGAANSSIALTSKGATLAATPTAVDVLVSNFAELATTANGFQQVVDDIDGRYVIQPGNGISLQGIEGAAGTAPIAIASYFWEEVLQGSE